MNKKIFLGLDTSNYTTSAAFYGEGVEVNSKKLLPVAENQVGLRQSDAVFHHVKQLPQVFEKACAALRQQGADMEDVSAIGVSLRPRTAEGSYMPCFLVGELLAKSLSCANNIPMYGFSHQQGHIAAALYSAGRLDLLKEKFIAFHLSGGTSEGVLVTPGDNNVPDIQLICGSTDLKAGQAIDRIGVKLGLQFPAGRYMDELAAEFTGKVRVKPSMKGADFSLSGVQNKCEAMIKNGCSKNEISRYCIEFIIASVDKSIEALKAEYGDIPIVFSGGVSSNSIMKEKMTKKYGAVFAEPAFSADNAFGAAALASLMEK